MLSMCYPEQCRADRLDGTPGARVRVIPRARPREREGVVNKRTLSVLLCCLILGCASERAPSSEHPATTTEPLVLRTLGCSGLSKARLYERETVTHIEAGGIVMGATAWCDAPEDILLGGSCEFPGSPLRLVGSEALNFADPYTASGWICRAANDAPTHDGSNGPTVMLVAVVRCYRP